MPSVGRHRQLPDADRQRRRRLARRAVTGTVLTVTAATVLVSGGWSRAGAAEQVLQAVTVKVGTDGSLTSVNGTDIAKLPGGVTTTHTGFAPKDVAQKLPITLSLSYLKDGVPGTDLSQLKDAKGRIEVDVTVTNATVSSRPVTYSIDGRQVTQPSLVGTPMTVTATATLPKGSYATIVQPSTAVPGSHTTNGAVSAAKDGSSTVSWAALLSPPQLSPTTTFALVEDASRFQLPSFSVSAQPGLVADPSVTSLITRTFSSNGDAVTTQDQAIALISQINGQLAQVSQTLGTIRASLGGTATELATSATQTLQQAGQQIGGAAEELGGELQSLQGTVSGSVRSSNDKTMQALTTTVDQLVAFLGVPAGTSPVFGSPSSGPTTSPTSPTTGPTTGPAPPTGTCGAALVPGTKPTTLYAQLQQVSSLTRQIGADGTACLQTTRKALLDSIGDSSTGFCTANGGAESGALVCELGAAHAALTAAASTLTDAVGGARTSIAGDTATALATAASSLALLRSATATVVGDLGALRDGDPATASRLQDLQDTHDALAALQTDLTSTLAPRAGAVQTSLTHLAGSTDTDSVGFVEAQLGSGDPAKTPPGSIQDEIEQAAKLACTKDALGNLLSNADLIDTLLVGTTCKDVITVPTGFDLDALHRLTAQVSALAALSTALTQQATAAGSLHDALVAEAGSFTAPLAQLQAAIDAASALSYQPDKGEQPGTPKRTFAQELAHAHSLAASLLGAPTATCDLTSAAPTFSELGDCLTAPTGTPGALPAELDQIVGKYLAVATGTISSTYDGNTGVLTKIANARDQAGAAGHATTGDIDALIATLAGQLDQAADQELGQGLANLVVQQKALLAAQTAAGGSIDAATTSALATLDASVTAATTAQSQVSTALAQEIALVQTNIGGTSGQGILGSVQDSVGQAATGADTVDGATNQATSFKGVRLAAVNQALLQAAQGQLAQQLAQQYPAFGAALPQGSTHNTVFVYQLASIG